MNTKGFANQKVIVGVFLVAFAVGTVFFGSYYLVGSIIDNRESAKSVKTANVDNLIGVPDTTVEEVIEVNNEMDQADALKGAGDDAEVIKKGWIRWQEPQLVGNLGLTTEDVYLGCEYGKCGGRDDVGSHGVKYIKAGDVIEGAYSGAEIFIISSYIYEGPSITPIFYKLLKKENEVIFLANHIDSFDSYTNNFIKDYFFEGSGKKVIDNALLIEELNYPDEFKFDDRRSFTKEKYGNDYFFHEVGIKPAFVHPELGQAWITDDNTDFGYKENFELNSYVYFPDGIKKYDDFEREGIYFKAPDGTVVIYKLKLDIFDKQEGKNAILQATWNDGQKNAEEYEFTPSGCGSGDYVYNVTREIDINNELIIVGKTDKGDNLYGYKDMTTEMFKELYKEVYWVKEDEQKKSEEEFLKTNPEVFWVDPFGRTLAFYRADIISPAECGKPVIYLYPEKPMTVNVKVDPGQGLSITDPQYGKDGWNVAADTESNLTNLEDGKVYPYLFWEGQGDVAHKTSSIGFVVEKKDLSALLDEKLAQLGLKGREIVDFKDYWIPEMTKNKKPYYFVTFVSRRFMDLNAPLTINPKPDTVIRVMMDYEELDQNKHVPELKIVTPERKGFTVVEWGGMLK